MPDSFPKKFYFGASTSAHQVEGGNHNDWTEWEEKNAGRLAAKADERYAKGGWPEYILKNYPSPLQKSNYISHEATDHYNRYEEDFDLAKKLGHNAHRFSIEWSRIEPAEGQFNEKEIEHYKNVIAALRKRNIEPFVTLWHWTLPLWLSHQGGVMHKDFSNYFSRYAEKMTTVFKDDVRFWLTINEPEIYCLNSYYRGRWAPQKTGVVHFYRAFSRLIKAHRNAYAAIKRVAPEATVGIVCNLSDFQASKGIVNAGIKTIAEWFWNHHFLRSVTNSIDCIGLNFYFHHRIYYGRDKNTNEKTSDMGWDLHPEGIERVLTSLAVYKKPIYITESGIADMRDEHREWFIKETISALRRAMQNGIDVRGYLYWSLLDNFEWDSGFWPRFGLIEVDYRTLKRKIRPSALAYKKITVEKY